MQSWIIPVAKGLVARVAAAIGFGLVSLFFSEFYFLNEGPVVTLLDVLDRGAGDTLAYLGEFALIYAGFAYVTLVLLWGPGGAGPAGAILSGAILGWLIEAVVIPLAYEAPPMSFIWPSLGWHMVVVFGLGWIWLRRAMRHWHAAAFAAGCIAIGTIWALWARVFWAEDPAMVLPPPDIFATYILTTGAVWLTGLWLADRSSSRFRPGWPDRVLALLLSVPLFVMMGIPFGIWGAALAAMVAVTLGALWRRRGQGLREPEAAPAPWRYGLAALLPVSAALAYTVLPEMPEGFSFLVTLPLIAVATPLWLWALWRGLRGL